MEDILHRKEKLRKLTASVWLKEILQMKKKNEAMQQEAVTAKPKSGLSCRIVWVLIPALLIV